LISTESAIDDDIVDEVSVVLKTMSIESSWSKKKSALRGELVTLLTRKRYLSFEGGSDRYLVSRVGESYLYDVPLYKQGLLKKFRGKRIRIVCIQSGRYKRGYMAGVVGTTPNSLLVTKLVQKYSFPAYATNAKAIYRTRRYLVFQPAKSISVFSIKEPKGFVDLRVWDSILVDGKDALPKGKLRHNKDGTVSSALLGWRGQHEAPTLKEAVDYLTDRIRKGWE